MTSSGPSDTGWRRSDRRMLLVAPAEAVAQFLPLILVAVVARTANDADAWGNLPLVVAPIVLGLWQWFTTTYRITADQIAVQRGVLARSTVTARLDRVRTVDVTASPLQRLLGVAAVRVGTGTDSPLTLPGLAAADARDLQRRLLAVTRARPGVADGGAAATVDTPLARFRPAWIGYAPFTLTGFLTIGAGLAFAVQFVDDVGEQIVSSKVVHGVERYVASLELLALVVQGVLATALLVALASIVTYVLRYWGYTLTRQAHGTLAVRRGLLTTRVTSVEERRLRGVVLERPFLLGLVRGAQATALVTGLGESGDEDAASDLLVPPAPRRVVEGVVADVLRDPAPVNAPLRPHGRAARRRRHARALQGALLAAVPAGAAVWWFDVTPWAWAAPVGLLLASPLLAEARYARLGHGLAGEYLLARQGLFPDRTTVVRTSAVIGWIVRETPFQRRVGLVTLTAMIAAQEDEVDVLDVSRAEAVALVRAATPGLGEPFMAPGAGEVAGQIQERNHIRSDQSSRGMTSAT